MNQTLPLSLVNQTCKFILHLVYVIYVYNNVTSLARGGLCYGAGYQSKTSSDGSKMDTTYESDSQSCELSNSPMVENHPNFGLGEYI